MRRYLIERAIPGAGNLSAEELKTTALKSVQVLAELGPGVQWVQSYVLSDRIVCIYYADSVEVLREHARCAGIPANDITEVQTVIDPTTAFA